ncbi:MAG: DUF4340 domain-containing protein, partial [Rhodothermales bacterium]|nr:DUF4340 domain-containing protein [Rhodothermales bacterium]
DIERIVIEGDQSGLEVTKTNGMWQMVSPIPWLADSSAISAFTRNLSELNVQSVVSRNPERYSLYGVESLGARISVEAGGKAQRFVVSREGPDYSSIYLRLEDDERVFIARPRLAPPSDVNLWRDKLIANISIGDIEQIGVRTPETNFVVKKNGGSWTVSDDEDVVAADSAEVARWIQNFATFRSDGFLPMETDIEGPTNILTFQLSSGGTANFLILERDSELALRYDMEPAAVYKLYTSRKATLFPDKATLTGAE